MATKSTFNTEGWAVIFDDGFVFKRQQLRLDPSTFARKPDLLPDPAFEFKERKKRRKKILLGLRKRYKNEIVRWEHLSNSLQALEVRNSIYPNPNPNPNPNDGVTREGIDCGGSQKSSLLSEVFLQVEAQEGIIRDCTQLCEAVENLCSAHEENAKQQFFDLPVWKSPRELMACLSEG